MTIFEDYHEDLLSRLFRAAYKDTGNNKFMYSQGNGALVFKVKEAIQEGAKDINVFIDAIPGNKSITKVYYNLKKVALENVGRVWVFPIVCAEYYFIQAFHDLCYLNSDTEIKCVLNKGDYSLSKLMIPEENRIFIKNFEKYCKAVLIHEYIDCIKHTRGIDNVNSTYGFFYDKDCLCCACKDSCYPMTVFEKSQKLIKAYPCHPYNSSMGDRLLDSQSKINLHKELVDSFNCWVDRYNTTVTKEKFASHIGYIH